LLEAQLALEVRPFDLVVTRDRRDAEDLVVGSRGKPLRCALVLRWTIRFPYSVGILGARIE